jgi:DNA-binding response OmpR family regulator
VRGTILFVIGDNELLREMTYKFRMHSYSVIAAIDVEEALESMKLVRPEVVVSSMEFSGGATGFDLFQAIRSISENRLTPFYFIAPKFDRTTLIIGKRLGVDDFFTEPVDYELLFSTLDGKLSTLRTQKPQRHSS